MRKKLPIGIDGFEKIRTNDFYYVDKTLFIKELLQNWGEVNLFTRPRRFGKTLNMSMLKNFFEAGSDPALFDGLKIAQEKEFCEKYRGKFPVISISLKSVDGLDFQTALTALKTVIGDEAGRFPFLSSSDKLTEDERGSYAQLTEVGSSQGGIYTMTDKVAAASLKTLSKLLSKHYGQKVILLIDEYDVPLDKAFQAGYYNEMISLIRNLLGNALKTNDSLYFSVLTGCLRISKESIFTGLNNLKVHTISDLRYDEYFGFTNADVDEILKFYGLTSYKDVIRDWYDGYRFGNTDVYCPWDVINSCDELLADPHAEPENYWANTSGNDLIQRLLKKATQSTKNDVEQLINGGTVTKPIRQELTYREVEDSISVRDTAVRRNMKENFYHGMLLGLLRSQDSWLVKSNAETGEGYSDISIQTPDRVGMIIELKYADDGNLEAACREALRQIEEKKYAEGPSGFLFILAAKPG